MGGGTLYGSPLYSALVNDLVEVHLDNMDKHNERCIAWQRLSREVCFFHFVSFVLLVAKKMLEFPDLN